MTAAHPDRVDALVDDRPAASVDVGASGTVTLRLNGWAAAGTRLALAAYQSGRLAASRTYALPRREP